jgi:hypothetical protein
VLVRRSDTWNHNWSDVDRNNHIDRSGNMEFLAGLAIGIIVGAVGLVVVALIFEEK